MIKILPNTRFSYSLLRGSQSQRINLSEQINRQIFDNLMNLYTKKDSCGIKSVEKIYNSSLPEKKKVKIYPMYKNEDEQDIGYSGIERYKGNFYRYWIQIASDRSKKLDMYYIPDFMHESTHVLDFLTQPKYTANLKNVEEKHIFEKKYSKLYEKYFYNTEGIDADKKEQTLAEIDKAMREKLEKVPFDEKIAFLNNLRYSLEMESHAYNQDLKYAYILKNRGKNIDEADIEDYNSKMYFTEKINIIKKYLAEEIQEERAKIKGRIKK